MAYRMDVKIKTPYKTKNECVEQLIDHPKKTVLSLFIKQLSGIMTPEGSFDLSSRYNAGAFFEYKGHIVETDDGVYLYGNISLKKIVLIFTIISTFIMLLLSPIFIIDLKIYGVLLLLFFLGDIGVILGYFKFSDALYKDIHKKFDRDFRT